MSTEETFSEQVKRVAKTCRHSKRRLVAELLESNRIISLDTRQIIALGNEVDGLKKRIQELETSLKSVIHDYNALSQTVHPLTGDVRTLTGMEEK